MLPVHHQRFVEETTSPKAHGTQGHQELQGNSRNYHTKRTGTDGTSVDPEMRWKNFGETTTEEGHMVFFSGKEDKHEQGVGFLVHKDIENTVMGCRQSPAGSSPFA